MPPGMKILSPVNGREQGREEKQREMNGETQLEVEETPEGHDADEDTLGTLLADQVGRQRRVPFRGESEGGVKEGEEAEADCQRAEDAVDQARDPLHSRLPEIGEARKPS